MAIRTIIKYGDPLLRAVSRPEDAFGDRLNALLDDLRETMTRAGGIGLAAAQVGVLRRAAVVENEGELYELVNPEIIKREGSVTDSEGCLSVPDERGEVARPETITVRTRTRDGGTREITVSGYTARAFCHEIDHMDGILFIDKLETGGKSAPPRGRGR